MSLAGMSEWMVLNRIKTAGGPFYISNVERSSGPFAKDRNFFSKGWNSEGGHDWQND
jgi:hypothetical protein